MAAQVEPQTGRIALQWAVSFLKERGWPQDKAQLESRLLLGKTKGQEGIRLLTALDEPLKPQTWELYQGLILRLSKHEPFQYLTEQQEFMGLPFRVNQEVLIPRGDTEVLVQEAMRHLTTAASPRILDLGTGSGAIAISLAYHLPVSSVVAVDISPEAVEVARDNARRLGVAERITFLLGDLFSPLPIGEKYDLIVSNPPYISPEEYGDLPEDVKREPKLALLGGEDGLAYYRKIAACSPPFLQRKGILLLEIGWQQGRAVSRILQENGYDGISILQDEGGRDRVILANRLN